MSSERDVEMEQEIDEILKFGKSSADRTGIETITIIGQIEGHYVLAGQRAILPSIPGEMR